MVLEEKASMFEYSQKTGEFRMLAPTSMNLGSDLLACGYAGRDVEENNCTIRGRNNPAAESIHHVGPLPKGLYTICAAKRHPHLGPVSLALIPAGENVMYGRGDFWIHGDNAEHDASHGCIILNLACRKQIDAFVLRGENRLQVVA
jgi:type VI secretion system (T6SS) effector TldE1-like protein